MNRFRNEDAASGDQVQASDAGMAVHAEPLVRNKIPVSATLTKDEGKRDEMSKESQEIRAIRSKALLSRDKNAIIDPASGQTIAEARHRHVVASKLHVKRRGTAQAGQVTEEDIDAAIEQEKAGKKLNVQEKESHDNVKPRAAIRQRATRGQRTGGCAGCP